MTHRLEGQLEYDPDSGGIFISLFPYPGEDMPSDQAILDAVIELLQHRVSVGKDVIQKKSQLDS